MKMIEVDRKLFEDLVGTASIFENATLEGDVATLIVHESTIEKIKAEVIAGKRILDERRLHGMVPSAFDRAMEDRS